MRKFLLILCGYKFDNFRVNNIWIEINIARRRGLRIVIVVDLKLYYLFLIEIPSKKPLNQEALAGLAR